MKNGKETENRKKRIKKAAVYSLLAVTLPFLAGLLLYVVRGIAPFGDYSILAMDLWGQYMPMYVQQAGVRSLSGLLHSWNGALGYNNWAQSAYYTNSLFLLILRLVPPAKMVEAVDWICLVKISLASLSAFRYLKKETGAADGVSLSGAAVYSLCAYSLAFISQPMWIDAMIFAPLILLALDRLVREKKGAAYSLLLGACIISNFYIGFCVCVFCVFWFLFRTPILLWEEGDTGVPAFLKAFARFALYSVLGGALSGLVILPTVMALGGTIAMQQGAPDKISWYAGVKAYLEMLLPGQSLKLEFKGVNIFSGVLLFSLLPVYFLNKSCSREERILDGLFTAVLFLSMNCNVLDYFWHGFHFPNQLPGRWTFLFSLYAVTLMAKGLARTDGLTAPRLFAGAGAGAVLWTAAVFHAEEGMISPVYHLLFLAGEIALVGIGAARGADRQPQDGPKKANPLLSLSLAAIAAVQIVGSAVNFLDVACLENGGLRTAAEPGYSEAIVRARALGDDWRSGEDDFYRIEAYGGTTFNPSMFGDYHGLSYYSSTMDGDTYRLLAYLGNRVYGQNVSSVYNLGSPVQNGLFGVKYLFDFSGGLKQSTCTPLAPVTAVEEGAVYENLTALPAIYAVADSAADFLPGPEVRAAQNQEAFLAALTGENFGVYEKQRTESFSYTNCILTESPDWNTNYFHRTKDDEPVHFSYVYRCGEAGPYFLENNFRAGTFTIRAFGREQKVQAAPSKLIYIGEGEEGDTVEIELEVSGVQLGCCGVNLYRFNEKRWEEAYAKLAASAADIAAAGETFLEGRISLDREALVMASVTQDGGWSFYCDGKKVETQEIAGVMPAARLAEGEHEISLRYHVPGLAAGCAVSAVGAAVLAAVSWLSARRRRR